MQIIVRFLAATALALAAVQPLRAQPELTLPFMTGAVQSVQANPAWMPDKHVYIALPAAAVGATHSGFAIEDLLKPVPGTDSLRVDIESALARMSDQNEVRVQARADALMLGIRVKGLFVHVSGSSRAQLHLRYPKSLAEVAWYGNAPYAGQELDLAPSLDAQAFHEIAAGASLRLGKLDLGARVKYLIGVGAVRTQRKSLQLNTDEITYDIALDADYEVLTSMVQPGDSGQFDPGFTFEALPQNRGLALDLGAQFRIRDRIVLGAGVLDLGRIQWKQEARLNRIRSTILFQGVDAWPLLLSDSLSGWSLEDSLDGAVAWTTQEQAFSTTLPAVAYLSAQATWFKVLKTGLIVRGIFQDGDITPEAGLYGGVELGKVLSAGLSYGYRPQGISSFGAQVHLKLGPLALYVLTEHLEAAFVPLRARGAQVRTGASLVF
ncbi:MAG: DUF5723 family protein [Bacteroidia bacterium]|nr:DUF5723 family protein [Bacteroidia bacterium]